MQTPSCFLNSFRTLIALVTLVFVSTASYADTTSTDSAYKPTVLITGANRGIGLEFVRQYAAKGWQVIATSRKPEKSDELNTMAANNPHISVERLDVTDDQQIAALAKKYSGKPIDILLNNAGYYGERDGQSFGAFDYAMFDTIMAVNGLAPLKMAQAFIDNVELSQQKKILTLASGLGSMQIGGRMGNHYFYKMSKAAMAMGMSSLRADLGKKGVVVAMIAPGMVETGLLRASKFRGKGISTEESVSGMLKQIETITSTKGLVKAINYDGTELPW